MSPLPAPTFEARQQSEALKHLILDDISNSQHWISFARFMEMALYTPGLGYYSGANTLFGKDGDFITAPELTPLFARSLAQQCAQTLTLTGGNLLEFGAGSGRLAHDLLLALAKLGSLPERYFILELSASLKQRQQACLANLPTELASRIEWLETLPQHFHGMMLGNEVLDAMPAHLVHWGEQGLFERGLRCVDEQLIWQDRPLLSTSELGTIASSISAPSDYVSEISLSARGWVRSLAQSLETGIIVLIDYGFPQAEYYHPQRASGTLMCHYRHHAHTDPLYWPGLQDLSVHVDFSALAATGKQAGLDLLGYTSQAQFLLNCGLLNQLAQAANPEETALYLPYAQAVNQLVSPAEMGELFKVMVLGKGIEVPLLGFSQGNRQAILETVA